MRDVKYAELIDELQKEFPIYVPKWVLRKTVTWSLSKLFDIIRRPDQQLSFWRGGITRIIQIHDGSRYIQALMDVDETKVPLTDKYYRGLTLAKKYKKVIIEDKTKNHVRQKIQIFLSRYRRTNSKTHGKGHSDREIRLQER